MLIGGSANTLRAKIGISRIDCRCMVAFVGGVRRQR
jgi:hypothetical protein